MHIPVITNRYSDGSVGVVHSADVNPASLYAPGHASRRWEWLFTGIMHVLCTAAIPCETDILQGSTPEACNRNRSTGMALCKPVNDRILRINRI